jgi:hypothetical protein
MGFLLLNECHSLHTIEYRRSLSHYHHIADFHPHRKITVPILKNAVLIKFLLSMAGVLRRNELGKHL